MKKISLSILLVSLLFISTSVTADEPFIFPRDGQSREQREIDKSFCYSWAEEETGVDIKVVEAKLEMMAEMEVERSAAYEDEEFGLGGMFTTVFKDAARGAALGAIDDAIDKEVGTYAAQEGLKSVLDIRSDKKDYEQRKEEDSRLSRAMLLKKKYEDYNRAFAVCMDAKGYSVR